MEQKIENFRAFTKLYGYIRYFYPGDEAQKINWNDFAVYGMKEVENCSGTAELSEKLQKIFRPIAPGLILHFEKTYEFDKSLIIPKDTGGLKLVAWQHRGVGLGDQSNIYESIRTNRDKSKEEGAEKLFDALPKAGEILTKELASGLYCSFPVALYSDSSGTLPKGDVSALSKLQEEINGSISEQKISSRIGRAAVISVGWVILQHFYPYFEVSKINWDPILTKYLEKAVNSDESGFYQLIEEFGAELKDGHVRIGGFNVQNCYSGIVFDRVEGKIVVTNLLDHKNPGVKIGDVVLAIDGIDIDSLVSNKTRLISSATDGWRDYQLAKFDLNEGTRDSDMRLKLKGIDGNIRETSVKRIYSVKEMWEKGWSQESRPVMISEISDGIMYVDLGRASMDDINKSMDKLVGAEGIVFDLRGYPNGNHDIISHLIDEPVLSARWNVPQIIYPDREKIAGYDTSGRWNLPPVAPRLHAKIIFLTNGSAISYAESFMAIIEAHKIADIVGGQTAGTNGNVNKSPLPCGYSMTWTGMLVLKHDGTQHMGVGVKPTIPVSKTIKGVAEGKDEILVKALEILKNRISK